MSQVARRSSQRKDDYTVQWRRGTVEQWTRKNPILSSGEPGLAIGTGNFKMGDGETAWNDLEWFLKTPENPGDDGYALQMLNQHISSLTPHAVYNDGPSLLLLYQNAKV